MRKMSKILCVICLIAIASTVLGGCGGTAKAPDQQAAASTVQPAAAASTVEEAAPAKPVTIRFSWWGADTRHKPYLATFEAYKKLNPNVTIEGEYQGFDGYQQKLMTQLAGGTAPDLMTIDAPWYPELAVKGDFFVDLNQQDILDFSDIDQKFVKDYGEFNGKMLGLPLGVNCTATIFNKTLADKLGIPTDIQYDWDTLLTEGKKLHDKDSNSYLLASDAGYLNGFVRAMLKQQTGKQLFGDDYILGFTNEQLLVAFNWVKKAYDDGVLQPLGESSLFNAKGEQNPKWINQQEVMVLDWNGLIVRYQSTLPKEIELTEGVYPKFKDSKDGASLVRPIFLMSIKKTSENLDEALKFANWYINDKEAAVILGSAKGVPSTGAQKNAAVEAGVINKQLAVGLDLGLKNMGMKENGVSTNTELAKIMTDQVSKVAFGMKPEEAVTETMKLFESKLVQLKAAVK